MFHLEHPSFPCHPLPIPLDRLRGFLLPASLAFPLHFVITPLCGLNTVNHEFSCLCTCHRLPDGGLPVGRMAPHPTQGLQYVPVQALT